MGETRIQPQASIVERRAALEAAFAPWSRRTLAQHFERACQRYADRPFLIINDEVATYGAVWSEAVRYAKALIYTGVKRREHIVILMANSADSVSLTLAASMLGAVAVPVNTQLAQEELGYILAQSESRHLVLDQTIRGREHGRAVSRLLVADLEGLDRRLRAVICHANRRDPGVDESFLLWSEFTIRAHTIGDAQFGQRYGESRYPDEVAILLYTPGLTGSPKGVMLTSDMLLRSAYQTCLSRAMEDGRIMLTPLPFYHCFALVEAILALSFVGGSIVSASGASPCKTLQRMEKYKANDYLCVPTMLRRLLNQPDLKKFDLSHWFAIGCGAAVPVVVRKSAVDLLGVTEITTSYGQTETASSAVMTELDDSLERGAPRVGRPKLAGASGLPEFHGQAVEYKTVDPESGNTLAKGAVGELVVRGNIVTRGYYGKPEETAAIIDEDGWFRTGDLGRIDDRGYLEVLGRRTDVFKVSGELVAPRAVEMAIDPHPAVRKVQVVGVPDAWVGEIGAAFIELKQGKTLTRAELHKWCASRLAKYEIPRYVWILDAREWPLTSSGKIQKIRLREMALARLAR